MAFGGGEAKAKARARWTEGVESRSCPPVQSVRAKDWGTLRKILDPDRLEWRRWWWSRDRACSALHM
jgi:hypothetical protein